MPAPGIAFVPPYDVHLVRGQIIILTSLVRINGQASAPYLASNPNIQLTFAANFKGSSLSSGMYTGFGITMFTDSTLGGVINTELPAPADDIRNFHLIAIVTDTNDSSTNEAVLRVHLHRSIKQAWLSPSILTVQKGIDGFMCSVRARFDDDVEAEIGTIHDLINGTVIGYNYGTTNISIAWSSPTVNLISPAGVITPGAAIATGLHNVTAVLSCSGINLAHGGGATVTANGQIFVADQLSGTRADITASLSATGDCPGFAKIDEVPNILIFPDGFRPEDRSIFDTLVDKYVSELTTGKISSPFDLLKGSLNFWKVFVTSGDRGAVTKGDMYLLESSGTLYGRAIFEGIKPVGDHLNPGDWTFSEITYKIGLPLRTDVAKSNSAIRTDWKNKTSFSNGDIDSIPNSAIDDWKKFGERRLPEEKDNIFGISINDYTAVQRDDDHNMIVFNPKRMSRGRLDTFLRTLRDDAGNLIGDRFVMTGITPGKDFDTIVFLSAAPFGRAQNFTGGFFTLIREDITWHRISGTINDFRKSIDVDNTGIENMPVSEKGTLTHELGHSFALEDEYGENPPIASWDQKFITDPAVTAWNFTAFSGAPTLADWSSNTQHRQDLLSPNTNLPGTGIIDATKIKWRFHRIKKCGVLASNPVQNGVNYTITLRAGQADAFTVGDKVFVRSRKAEEFQLVIQRSGASVRIINSATPPASLFGLNLTVTVITTATNTVQATEGANTHTFTVRTGWTAFFNVGDILNIGKNFIGEPIASMVRTPSAVPATTSDTITYAVSSEFEVDSVNTGANQVVIKPAVAGNTLSNEYTNPEPGSRMILYCPVPAPASVLTATYKYAEMISKKVLDHLTGSPFPFNAIADSSNGNALTEIIDRSSEQNSSIPGSLVPCCSSRKKEIVGLYSGGRRFHGNSYHPTGHCFMRSHTHGSSYDEFCAVCKYILVDIIDPSKHGLLDEQYAGRKIYPE